MKSAARLGDRAARSGRAVGLAVVVMVSTLGPGTDNAQASGTYPRLGDSQRSASSSDHPLRRA